MSAKNLDKHNRWRNKTVAFRVSAEEDLHLEALVKLTGLTKQDYIIRRLLERDVVVQGNPRVYKALRDQLAAVLDELRRIEAGQGVSDELLDTILHRETERALDEFEATGSWEECMISASRFAREHKRAVYHIYTSSHRLELEKHVDRISGEMMRSYVERQAKGLRVSEQDKKLVCDLYRFGITDIFYEWLENGMKEDLEAQIRRLSLLFTGNIRASLSRVQIPEEF